MMGNIMKEFDMLLPTVRQADMIKLALDDGYIYYTLFTSESENPLAK